MCKKLFILNIIIASLVLLTACVPEQGAGVNVALNQSMKAQEPDQGLKLWIPREMNSLKIGDSVILALDNQSKDYIVMPADYGIHLYAYQEKAGQWKELKNNTEAFPVDTQIELPPKESNLFSGATVTVNPSGLPVDTPAVVRVVVVGNVAQNHAPTNKQVIAYIDFTLQP